MTKTRLIITLPNALKKAVSRASEHRGCSKAEVVRTSLYEHLKRFIEVDESAS